MEEVGNSLALSLSGCCGARIFARTIVPSEALFLICFLLVAGTLQRFSLVLAAQLNAEGSFNFDEHLIVRDGLALLVLGHHLRLLVDLGAHVLLGHLLGLSSLLYPH